LHFFLVVYKLDNSRVSRFVAPLEQDIVEC